MKHNISVFSLLFSFTVAGLSQTQQVTLNTSPSRSVGQVALPPPSGAPNRIEGREFNGPIGIAIDTSATPPILYVSDFSNNRVLAWKNASTFSNGARADLVIGQPDLLSNSQQGPGRTNSAGLTAPTGIAVNNKGDLYVADNGNNRVLRFPKPFSQSGQPTPDLWLGQPSLNNRNPNSTGQVSASGLSLSTSNSLFVGNLLAFDSSGNLWVADPGNLRVIRFAAAGLGCKKCTDTADIVIGQPNLSTVQTALANNAASFPVKNQFGVPAAVAFDASGRLYVADQIGNQGRVLVFGNPSGQPGNAAADRVMGVVQANQITNLQGSDRDTFVGKTLLFNPNGIFVLPDGSVGVVDTGFNRILVFPPIGQWPAETTYFSPQANSVIGQNDFVLATSTNPNQVSTASLSTTVTPVPNPGSLNGPYGAVFLPTTNELFITDSNNNRVVVRPQSGGSFGQATRVLGQDLMTQFSPNLIEGKEFNFQADTGIALDTTGSTPHLWVSDPNNNRVLGFADARKIGPDSRADIVIGQPNLQTAVCNYPSGDAAQPQPNTLCRPVGVLVDSQGNLYVADSFNSRVLRFPNPWNYKGGGMEQADLVLGQSNFVSQVLSPSATTMGRPYGLAFSGNNGLLVSDSGYNRVLYFPFSGNGTFTAFLDNGKPATKVFGQNTFGQPANPPGSGLTQLNAPRHIATDTSGQLYVVDSNNNRVLVFGDPASAQTPATNATANISLPGLNSPRGIYVNSGTGEIWVANTNSGTLVRYPKYDLLIFNATPSATLQNVVNNTLIPALAVAQDQYGDLFVADADNRVIVYYQGFTAVNAATSLARPLAPMMLATLYASASATQFGANTATASGTTWPISMGDIQVLVNGTPAPLYYVSPGQINFYISKDAPAGQNVEVAVVQQSTGQVLGASQVAINSVAPGLYTSCQSGQSGTVREACAVNEDGTINDSSHPAARGTVISLYGTGQGAVSNPPADGQPAPTAPLAATPSTPRVIIGTCYVDDCGAPQPGDVGTSTSHSGQWVSYSGLAPGFIGLWQVNVQIPMAIPPATGGTNIDVVLNNVPSYDTTSGFRTFIYVK